MRSRLQALEHQGQAARKSEVQAVANAKVIALDNFIGILVIDFRVRQRCHKSTVDSKGHIFHQSYLVDIAEPG